MSNRRSRRRSRGLFVAALSAVLSLAALGSGAVGDSAAGSAQASTLPTLTLAITNAAITVSGATQSGAVNVISTASGVKEARAVLFLLKPGVSYAELEGALDSGAGKDPNEASRYGAIVFDVEVIPGHRSETQTYLQPGQYVALVPGEGKGPKAHALFTVSAATSPAALPLPQATVRSVEFGFRGPGTLRDGEVVRFENEGFLVHMDVAFRVRSKSAAQRAVKDLSKGDEGGVERLTVGVPVTFAGPLSNEGFQQETITARPGWYVEACFMETQDGRADTLLGMERIIKILK